MRVAGELGGIGVVVNADHVGNVLEVEGAPAQRLRDCLSRACRALGLTGVQLAGRDEVDGQGPSDGNQDQGENRCALKGLCVHRTLFGRRSGFA